VNRALREADGVELDNEPAKREVADEGAWMGIDHQEEYIDEDRYTTVTIEAVDVSKEGLQKVEDDPVDTGETVYPPKLADENKKKKWPKKEKKKKFRYESKAERKATRTKQKVGNKAKADSRRDK
jgi:ribosomal RNA-processing protein 17